MTVSRTWSAAALALIITALALAIVVAVAHFPKGVTVLACGIGAVFAAWYGIRRRGPARAVGIGAATWARAGGDGSQAIVAMIAAELDLPYACIPAGTRNHFALDLGVARDDVVGALDAFVDGGERRVDLAEVNGRVFVNNVSLGLYAEAVQRAGYREAKIRTLLDTVPDVIGPDAQPPHLHWRGRDGEESGRAVLVSNDVYRLGRV